MMKNTRLLVKYLFLSIGLCIWGSACTPNGGHEKVPMDDYMQFYHSIVDSLSKNPSYVCHATLRKMETTCDSMTYYHYITLLSKAYMFKSEVDSVNFYMTKAEAFCDRLGTASPDINELYGEIYNMRGNVCVRQGLADSAVVCFHKAFDYCLKGTDKEPLPDISINLADAYTHGGYYDKGAMWYRKALSYSDTLNIPEEKRFPVYYGLATVYTHLRDFASADYYYDSAKRYYDRMMPFEKHYYLNNRGNSYYFRGDYPKALEMFHKMLEMSARYPEMEFEKHLTELNLGETFLLMERTDSAEHYLNLCSNFFHEIGHQSAIYYLDTQLIELALKQNNLALAHRRMAEAVSPEQVEPSMLHIRNRYLQHYFEQTGDFKQAYHYQKMNQRIDDSIRNERIKMRTAEIDLKYKQDTTLMKQKIFIQQKENEVLELNQTLYVWMSICFCVLVLVFFIYIYNKKQRSLLQMRNQNMITALRMENIRNRVSPHFIFNILNREMGNYTDEQAGNMHGLIKLMRRNLELTERLCVTMAEELDFVNTFIDLQRKALGENFVPPRRKWMNRFLPPWTCNRHNPGFHSL